MSKYGNLFGASVAEGVSQPPLSGDTAGKYALLFVDDEPGVLRALTRVFEDENYQVLTVPDGEQALNVLEKNDVQLVISDFMMPRMNGAQFLSRVKSLYPDMIQIMLTGHADTRAVMGAINEGAVYKFILKPWHDDDLRITVVAAQEQYELKRRNKQLEDDNERKQKQIKTLNKPAVTNRSQIAIMLHKLNYLRSIVSRIKVMSELDISERRRPQDSRVTVKTPLRMVDLRISTLPTINGEKVVLRLLDKHSSIHNLEDQGFSGAELEKVKTMIRQPQGIVLVTGPTGSGKTTTLYTLLQHNAITEKKLRYYRRSSRVLHGSRRTGQCTR